MKLSLACVALTLGAFFIAASLPKYRGIQFAVSQQSQPADAGAPQALRSATDEEMQNHWAGFRGPHNRAIATGSYPTHWDGPANHNIAWKTPVPIPGPNSPIVWNDRVFISGGTDAKREIYCLNAGTGAIKWSKLVSERAPAELKVSDDQTWAASTLATDGRRVFGIFPTGDVIALDFDGNLAWKKNLWPLKTHYGHAASLLVFEGLLILQMDQGTDAAENVSYLLALDCATGNQKWKTPRPVPSSWSTPMIVPGPQLITLGDPWIIAYEPKTGTEIWRAKALGGEVAPSPAFANGKIYAAVERADLVSITIDGKGDVSKTHLKKHEPEVLPDIVSLAALGDRVLITSTGGLVEFFDTVTSKQIWNYDVEAGFNSSPIVVNEKLVYLIDKTGVTHILDLGDSLKVIAKLPLGEPVSATPAFHNGRIFIRSNNHLFCIAAKEAK